MLRDRYLMKISKSVFNLKKVMVTSNKIISKNNVIYDTMLVISLYRSKCILGVTYKLVFDKRES